MIKTELVKPQNKKKEEKSPEDESKQENRTIMDKILDEDYTACPHWEGIMKMIQDRDLWPEGVTYDNSR